MPGVVASAPPPPTIAPEAGAAEVQQSTSLQEALEDGKPPNYTIALELLQKVLNATSPADIPVKERNKVYAAMGRECGEAGKAPPAILAKYAEARYDKSQMFLLLKEWAQCSYDKDWASMDIKEEHIRKSTHFKAMEWEWLTKADVYIKYDVVRTPENKELADAEIAAAKRKKHPVHKTNPKFMLYRVLKKIADGHQQTNEHATKVGIKTDVPQGHQAKFMQFAVEDNFAAGMVTCPAAGESPAAESAQKAKVPEASGSAFLYSLSDDEEVLPPLDKDSKKGTRVVKKDPNSAEEWIARLNADAMECRKAHKQLKTAKRKHSESCLTSLTMHADELEKNAKEIAVAMLEDKDAEVAELCTAAIEPLKDADVDIGTALGWAARDLSDARPSAKAKAGKPKARCALRDQTKPKGKSDER